MPLSLSNSWSFVKILLLKIGKKNSRNSYFWGFSLFAIFGPFVQFWAVFHFGAFLHFWVVRGGCRGGSEGLGGHSKGLGGVWEVGAGFGGSGQGLGGLGGSRCVCWTPKDLFFHLWKSCRAPNLVPNTT